MNSRNLTSNGGNIDSTPDNNYFTVMDFTSREREVLGLVATGKSNHQISLILNITIRTVRCHIANIMEKLQAHNRTEAVFLATQKGWLDYKESSIQKENH
jgi:DNA-binding NarL/FixJ family response regulator